MNDTLMQELLSRIEDWLHGEVRSEDGSCYSGESSFEKGVRAGRLEGALGLQGMIAEWQAEIWPDRKEAQRQQALREDLTEARTCGISLDRLRALRQTAISEGQDLKGDDWESEGDDWESEQDRQTALSEGQDLKENNDV